MAHYALLDSNNIVTQVITGKDETDTQHNWEQYYGNIHNCVCKRTSYNTRLNEHTLGGTAFRGNYAGIGFSYDSTRDVFIPPKPYASWSLDENTYSWVAPVDYPDDGNMYSWDEDNQTWVVIE